MIEYFLRKIPSTDVSLDNTPYLEEYYDYVIEKISSGITGKKLCYPKFYIKNSPYYESLFIEHSDGSAIIFDIAISSLIKKVNDILIYGIISRDSWLKLLEVAVNFLICSGFPDVGIAFALHRNWDWLEKNRYRSGSNIVANFSKSFFEDAGNQSVVDVKCSEMFLLAHEIAHYYISKGIYKTENAHRVIFEDIIKYECGDCSVKMFFLKLFGNVKDEEEKIFYKKLRKLFLSKSFKEEIICDLIAFDITIEYFTWDSRHYMKLPDVCASIQTTMRSLFLIISLRNNFIPSELTYHIWLRIKIIDKMISKTLLTYTAPASKEDDYIFFNVIHNTTLRNRLSVIEQCLFGEITSIILNLQDFYKKIPFKINDIKTTALYCLGYNTIKTERKQFIENDLNILHRNKDILRAMQRSDRVDLYKISASSKKRARKIMNSV